MSENLDDAGLHMTASAEVETDVVNPMVIQDSKIIIECQNSEDTWQTIQMTKLDS